MNSLPMKVAIQRNPISGSGRRDYELKQMIAGLKASGMRPYLFTDRQRLADHLHNPRFREELFCIVAAGGDGTVDDLINRYPGVPLAIFAMGTENLLAKHCGMPRSGLQVARIIADRKLRTIDLGLAGQRRFAVMASCGFDATVVSKAHAARRGRITKLHYIKPILSTLRTYRQAPIQTSCGQLSASRQAAMVIISNVPRYALNLPINPLAVDDDGLLDVCLIQQTDPTFLIRKFLSGKLRGQINGAGIERFQCQCLRLIQPAGLDVQADGDPIGKTPLEIRVLPRALDLLVPVNQDKK